MLELLSIQNLAVIESAALEFKAGLNILSGETGSGKSIVVESIGLLLGGRASPEMIRAGKDEASVEGVFQLSGPALARARAQFEQHGFPLEGGEILIKRLVSRSGKSRVFVNGQVATLQVAAQLTRGLIDFCGQHENQTLTRAPEQLELIDRYGKTETDAAEARGIRRELRAIESEIATISEQESERERQLDYVRFQLQELDRVAPQPGEDELLQTEKKLLQSSEQRLQLAEGIRGSLDDEDTGVLQGLRGILPRLKQLIQTDPTLEALQTRLDGAQAELEFLSQEVGGYLERADARPERLLEVQERIADLSDLKRKYGGSLEEAIAARESLQARERELSGMDERRGELAARAAALAKDLAAREKKLRAARLKASEKLARQIEVQLNDLRMEGARFEIGFGAEIDEVHFLIRTNAGEELKPLGRIASGGELSRVMLAVRNVLTESGNIGVYLFDEIDAGMGGQTAFVVGRKLRRVSEKSQVICITHLAQVAAFADHQFAVHKHAEKGRTFTTVAELAAKDRKLEIARMLGGLSLTPKALQNAEAILAECVREGRRAPQAQTRESSRASSKEQRR